MAVRHKDQSALCYYIKPEQIGLNEVLDDMASRNANATAIVNMAPHSTESSNWHWFDCLGHPLIVGVILFFVGRYFERKEKRSRSKELWVSWLLVVADEVQKNLRLLAQLDAYLWVGIMPSFSLSLYAPQHAFKELSARSHNPELLKDLFGIYYEFKHVQDRLDDVRELNERIEHAPLSDDEHEAERLRIAKQKLVNRIESTRQLARSQLSNCFEIHTRLAVESKIERLPLNHISSLYREFQAADEVVDRTSDENGPLSPYE